MERQITYAALSVSALFSFAVLLSGYQQEKTSYRWVAANSMLQARSGACSAVLPDGSVLISGGEGETGPLATSEVFNPVGNVAPAAPMLNARSHHACVSLNDGRVLVAGGESWNGTTVGSAEVYNPQTRTWSQVRAMGIPRSGGTASLLGDGRVLMAGGKSEGTPAAGSLEIYDPAHDAFNWVPDGMASGRTNHAAAVLKDGRVLIAGGSDGRLALDTVDLFDPSTGAVSPLGRLSTPRTGLSATTLLDGRVYFAGGNNGEADLATTEIYNPVDNSFLEAAPMSVARRGHIAVRIQDNNSVLLAGGTSNGEASLATELYIPWWNSYRELPPPSAPTAEGTVTGLKFRGAVMMTSSASTTVNTATVATITTDKSDYQPGDYVTITGAGWKRNEIITFDITRSPTPRTFNPALTTTADANGIFQFRPNELQMTTADIDHTYTVTATGNQGSTAQTITFTDGNLGDNSVAIGLQTPTPTSPGGSASYTVTVTFTGNSAECTVTLDAIPSGAPAWPAGATFVFTPGNSFTGTGGSIHSRTLTITTPAGITPDTYNFTVRALQGVNCQNQNTRTRSGTLVVGGDTTPPTVTINQAAGQTDPTNASPINFIVVFSEPVSNFTAGDVTLSGAAGATTATVTGSGTTYNVAVSGMTSQGAVTASIAAGVASDATGNPNTASTSTDNTVTYDNVAPITTAIASTVPGSGTYTSGIFTNQDVQLVLSATDNGGSGAKQIHYSINDGGEVTVAGASVTLPNFTTTGTQTVSFYAVDTAGNSETPQTFTIKIDKIKPVITGSALKADSSVYTAGTWTNQNVTVNFTCTDNGGSGVDPANNNVAGTTLVAETTVDGQNITNTGTCKDLAGNTADSTTFGPVKIDQTAPSTTHALSGTAGSNDWYISNVQVTLTASDVLSGVDETYYKLNSGAFTPYTIPFSITTEGETTVQYYSTDNAGNMELAKSVTVRIDKIKPVITGSAVKADSSVYTAGTWTNQNVTVNFACTDNGGSGVDPANNNVVGTTLTAETTVDGQNVTNMGTCKDSAGNTADHATFGPVKIDKTAPTTTHAVSGTAGSNDWYVSNLQVTLNASDVPSGVKNIYYKLSSGGFAQYTAPFGITAEGHATVQYYSIDNAGNAEPVKSFTVKIDKTSPTIIPMISGTLGTNDWYISVVNLSWTVMDNLSGLATPVCGPASITSDTTPAGVTITCSATDNAGLSSSVPVTIKVDKSLPMVANVLASPNPVPISSALTTSVLLTADVSDAASGIESVKYSVNAATPSNMVAGSGNSYSADLGTFPNVGVYSICVIATDKAGNARPSECTLLAVYDPTAGFVTGGGWINSPAGASTQFPDATGKANLGFVAKYKKGQSTPEGQTQFDFQAGNLNFHSETYSWLVISGPNSSKAQFKGTGTIKGMNGTYNFLLTGIDGDLTNPKKPDSFRIKIMERLASGGDGATVYDNRMNESETGDAATNLGGGSIVIHAK